MLKREKKTADLGADQGAAAGTEAFASKLDYPQHTIKAAVSQDPADNGNSPDIDYLELGFEYFRGMCLDLELNMGEIESDHGPVDTLKYNIENYHRVRNNLADAEREALDTLCGHHLKGCPPGVQKRAINLVDLSNNYDELEALADAMGILPGGATWADMVERLGPVTWAWKPWLAPGFLTLVASEPGQGKSMLCLRIAATFLRGDPWPDGTPYEGETGAVIWCEAEAAQALNLERAKAWGLPLDKIYTPLDDPLEDVQLGLSEHQEAINLLLHRPEVKLMIVDSLRGVYRGDENSSASMEVVKLLAELARNHRKPAMLTHHLRKRGMLDLDDRVNLDRVRGSSAIIQTARLVWAIDQPDITSDTRRLSVIKNNMARFPDPVGLDIGDLGIEFGEAPERPRDDSPVERAIDLLRVLLDDEPMRQPDIEEEAKGAGISWASMRRAKKRLDVVSRKQPDGWYWALPARDMDDDTLIN